MKLTGFQGESTRVHEFADISQRFADTSQWLKSANFMDYQLWPFQQNQDIEQISSRG